MKHVQFIKKRVWYIHHMVLQFVTHGRPIIRNCWTIKIDFIFSQEWDPNNYLVDLSGGYSLCKHMHLNGRIRVKEKTPEGYSVGGLTATYSGAASDVDSVETYIKQVMPSWLKDTEYANMVTTTHYYYYY